MRCKNCSGIIPPEWVHCITKNECPGCGSELMNDSDKQLLTELSEAMTAMPNNPQGLAGWLLSNYELHKIGEARPVEKFHNKRKSRPTEDDSVEGMVTGNDFLKNSNEYKSINETKAKLNAAKMRGNGSGKIAQMAKAISEIDADEDMYGNGTADLSAGEPDEAEYTEEQEYEGDGSEMSMKHALASAGQSWIDPKAKPLSKSELQALQAEVKSHGSNLLNDDRVKRLKSRDAFESGGGWFKRDE